MRHHHIVNSQINKLIRSTMPHIYNTPIPQQIINTNQAIALMNPKLIKNARYEPEISVTCSVSTKWNGDKLYYSSIHSFFDSFKKQNMSAADRVFIREEVMKSPMLAFELHNYTHKYYDSRALANFFNENFFCKDKTDNIDVSCDKFICTTFLRNKDTADSNALCNELNVTSYWNALEPEFTINRKIELSPQDFWNKVISGEICRSVLDDDFRNEIDAEFNQDFRNEIDAEFNQDVSSGYEIPAIGTGALVFVIATYIVLYVE